MRPKRWAAFEEFVREQGDSLVRLSFLLCGDQGRAEDATQEALTRLYLRWGRVDEPLPYVRRCVVNATHDQWRRASRQNGPGPGGGAAARPAGCWLACRPWRWPSAWSLLRSTSPPARQPAALPAAPVPPARAPAGAP